MWSVAAPRAAQPRRDPAPTRWSYRFHRMMLTPGLRFVVLRLVPLGVVLAVLAMVALTPQNRARMAETWERALAEIAARPEFAVNAMAVLGADEALQRDIRVVLPYEFPQSRFELDLDEMRAQVAALPAVRDVAMMMRPGGVLEVNVTQRTPVAIWRAAEGLWLVDQAGVRLRRVPSRAARADLPVVAGQGADAAVGEAQALIAALGPLAPRLRGLERLGARRWDVVLDRNQRIMLPEAEPLRRLEQVVALAQASDLLERDIVAVDMRVPRRPTLRMTPGAAESLRRTRIAVTEDQ